MDIDMGAIIEAAVGAAADAVKQTAPQVEDFLREIMRGHANALTAIAAAFASGDIDEDSFDSEMEDESKTLQAELQAVAVLTKAIAQRAINAFQRTLVNGIKAALAAAI